MLVCIDKLHSMLNISESCRQLIISDLHGDVFDELLNRKVLNNDEYKAVICLVSHMSNKNKLLTLVFIELG